MTTIIETIDHKAIRIVRVCEEPLLNMENLPQTVWRADPPMSPQATKAVLFWAFEKESRAN